MTPTGDGMNIAGRWSTSTGVLVFIGSPKKGYAYQELNTLGSIIGEGAARLAGTRVDIRGNNLIAGPVSGVFALAEDGKALRGVFTAEKFGPDGTSTPVELLRVEVAPPEQTEPMATTDGRETYVGYLVLIGRPRAYALDAWERLTPAERAEWSRAAAAVKAEGLDNMKTSETTCSHGVTFDRAEAAGMTVEEIRKRWPRGWFPPEKPCQTCGFVGIAYASDAHFVYGDW